MEPIPATREVDTEAVARILKHNLVSFLFRSDGKGEILARRKLIDCKGLSLTECRPPATRNSKRSLTSTLRKAVVVGKMEEAVGERMERGKGKATVVIKGFCSRTWRSYMIKCPKSKVVSRQTCAIPPIDRYLYISLEGFFL